MEYPSSPLYVCPRALIRRLCMPKKLPMHQIYIIVPYAQRTMGRLGVTAYSTAFLYSDRLPSYDKN